MRTILSTATALLLSNWVGAALADDHLVEALEHGLTEDSQPFQTNPSGFNPEEAPGQGSPFSGEHTQTPATDSDAANEHARIKTRG